MRGSLIAAHLLRVDRSLSLTHPWTHSEAGLSQEGDWTPGMLVIPRGGGLREPHLVTLKNSHGPWDVGAPTCVMTDPHTVLHATDSVTASCRPAADVVVRQVSGIRHEPAGQPPYRRHDVEPDCEISVAHRPSGCLLRMRSGGTVEINELGILPARGCPPWPAVYGSFLHCWLSAGLPIGSLGDAVVAAGHYYVGTSLDGYHFAVVGRTHISVHRSWPVGPIDNAA